MASQPSLASSNIPLFVQNQILRAQDLNRLVEALQAQLRQTRVFNIGVGIVNGLTVSCDDVDNPTAITITGGLAISSDGYQFELQACDLTNYRPITLSRNAFSCDSRQECNSDEDLIETSNINDDDSSAVFELEEFVNGAPSGWKAIDGDFIGRVYTAPDPNDPAPITTNYCLVLLWCEDQIDRKSCFNECEEKGADRFTSIRKLLIRQAEYESIFTPDEDGEEPDPRVQLPGAPMIKRFGYVGGKIDLCAIHYWEDLYNSYINVCGNDDLIDAIATVYSVAHTGFYEKKFPDSPNPFGGLGDDLDEIYPLDFSNAYSESKWDIQYFYTYLRDLITAYQEFCDTANGLSIQANSDESLEKCLFPGHVSLGWVKPDDNKTCRTGRILPNIFPETQERIDLATCLYERMVAMVQNRRLPMFAHPQVFDIRITPSAHRFRYLGQRALPFYYTEAVKSKWNCESDKISVPYYEPVSSNPLLCELCAYDFFRVEGHLNKSLGFARDRIQTIRRELNIPFDLLEVRIGPGLELEEKKDMEVGELEEVYQNTRVDILCKLDELKIDGAALPQSLIDLEAIIDESKTIAELPVNPPVFLDEKACDDIGFPENFFSEFNSIFSDAVQDTIGNNEQPSFHPDQGKLIEELAKSYYTFKLETEKQRYFPSFAKAHPGLEHKGGAPKGGTLVLVYAFFLSGDLRVTLQLNQFNSIDWLANVDVQSSTDEELIDLVLLHKTELTPSGEETFLELLQKNTSRKVVADFCLPYLCCSNAPIIRNEIKAIRPKLEVRPYYCCPEEDITAVLVTVSPAGGVLKVKLDGDEVQGQDRSPAELEEVFDVSAFSGLFAEDPYRSKISFTYLLGGEVVEADTVIYKLPAFDVANTNIELIDPFYELVEEEDAASGVIVEKCVLKACSVRITTAIAGQTSPKVKGLKKLMFCFGNDEQEQLLIIDDGLVVDSNLVDKDGYLLPIEQVILFEWGEEGKVPLTIKYESGPCRGASDPLEIDLCQKEVNMKVRQGVDDESDIVVGKGETFPVNVDDPDNPDIGFFELLPDPLAGEFIVTQQPADGSPQQAYNIVVKTRAGDDCSTCRYFLVYDQQKAIGFLSDADGDGIPPAGYPLTAGMVDSLNLDGLVTSGGSALLVNYSVEPCTTLSLGFVVKFEVQGPEPGNREAPPETPPTPPQGESSGDEGTSTPPPKPPKEEESGSSAFSAVARSTSAQPTRQARKLMSDRQSAYLDTLAGLKEYMGSSKGYKLANMFVTTQGDAERLIADYREAANSLLLGHRSANEENKPRYLQVLEVATFSLMDKLAIQAEPAPEAAAEALQATAAAMEEAGLKLATVRRRWKASDLKKVLEESRVTQLLGLLKVK